MHAPHIINEIVGSIINTIANLVVNTLLQHKFCIEIWLWK